MAKEGLLSDVDWNPVIYWVYLLIFSLALGSILAMTLVWLPESNQGKAGKIIALVVSAGVFIGTFILWLKLAWAKSWCREMRKGENDSGW